ncbi:hypothetical protein SEA_ROSIEPOSIE_75 [Arthrobacter phage RosiePosie]|uniref:Uncharacterized protein n=12 Tax=Klausavirus princesstrina TaxID=1984784 RepID=A0A286N488_9CAUD|nr:hypothetical protein FDI82_gp076 [Arthrobacter phage PrincessTrina]ANU79676.1 hypothetical protein SEA_CONBOY_74 [Arthrobacter phage Conboy]AOZ64738.1 hypothetical protein SEA_CHOCOLAT_75 [Arthrobacter phage Chocolat]APC44757.1 hypothetical protein SEA_EDGARPOE_74 [Arthrobacter phage EdgarPoe]APC44869.1 hypothetical protein SEA_HUMPTYDUMPTY_75 [Arthrobacter phage HumptyDumpty]ASX98859.1 hypothetical protein SEA_KABREEZE_75 [Arthrobacter phage Kabreeze]ASX98970.1 hypothetical protein SEA_RO
MKQGKYWCLVLTITAGVMFATEIWVADGRYAAMGWLAVGGAIIAGLVGITQAVKSEAKELKKHPALGWEEEQAREGRD